MLSKLLLFADIRKVLFRPFVTAIQNLVQISTKMRIELTNNRNLVQISTNMRLNICIIQKKVLTLQRILKYTV